MTKYKIVQSYWFSSFHCCIGIVEIENSVGEHKFYIGPGGGQQSRAKDYTIVKNNTDFMNNGFDYENVLSELVRMTKGANIVCFCSNSQIAKLMTWFENNKIKATLTAWKKQTLAL